MSLSTAKDPLEASSTDELRSTIQKLVKERKQKDFQVLRIFKIVNPLMAVEFSLFDCGDAQIAALEALLTKFKAESDRLSAKKM